MNIQPAIRQRADGDCGVAALAEFAEISYEDAYVAVRDVDPDFRGKSGLNNKDVLAASKKLGVTLTATRKYDLDDDNGVLRVRWNKGSGRKTGGHWVAVKNGLIICPTDGVSRSWRDYLEMFDGRACTLLKGNS